MDSDADGGDELIVVAANARWTIARASVLRIVMPSMWTCLYVATHHPGLLVHPWWYRSGYSI